MRVERLSSIAPFPFDAGETIEDNRSTLPKRAPGISFQLCATPMSLSGRNSMKIFAIDVHGMLAVCYNPKPSYRLQADQGRIFMF